MTTSAGGPAVGLRAAMLCVATTSAWASTCGPTGAATHAECVALLGRLGLEAGSIAAPSGSCFFRDVTWGEGEAGWRADVLALFGDSDALPDALPSRLTGGVVGLRPSRAVVASGEPAEAPGGREGAPEGEPEAAGTKGDATGEPADVRAGESLAPEGQGSAVEEQGDAPAAPRPVPMTITFNVAGGGGMLRVDALSLKMGDLGTATLSGMIAGLPQVFPAEPAAMARMRVQSADLHVEAEGLLEALLALAPGLSDGAWTGDLRTWLGAFADEDGQGANGAAATALLEDWPAPRGVLELRLRGDGLPLARIATLLAGRGLRPAQAAEVARAVELDLTWTPDAP